MAKTDFRKDHARCIPVLPSRDLAKTRAFYVGRLKFRGDRFGDYLIVKREDMELHFQLAKGRGAAKEGCCYIRGGQAVALYDEFAKRRVPGLSDFAVRPWNMKEFTIHDPDGHVLRFACAPEGVGDKPYGAR